MEKMHNGCVLMGDVGTGKSITAMAYFFDKICGGTPGDRGSIKNPTDVYIITTAKKRDSLDWEEEANKFGINRDREVSIGGIGITVDSWNNIGKYTDVEDAFFILDEQRIVGSGAWTKSFIKIAKHNQWILLSATPGDTWLDYIPVFVANGFYKNRTAFKREHVVYNTFSKFPKVDRYIGVSKLVRNRDRVLVEMPYERHTTRHGHYVEVSYDQDLFKKVVDARWHVYEERPLMGVSELFSVMRKVVNSDATRVDEIRSLLSRHPKLIVFYNFDYELEMLRELGKPAGTWTLDTGMGEMWVPNETASDFVVAEWNGHRHDEIPQTDRWLYLVQYTAGSEGWNCVETNAMAFFSLTYSYKQFHQAHGRIDRLNTPFNDLHYYYLRSKSMIDQAVWRSLRSKKRFNERDYARNWEPIKESV